MNIIGDVAGQFDTLMALVKKMPDEEFMFLGDLVDRGPKSKEVVEWIMKNSDSTFGNHEHLMLNEIRGLKYYEPELWWTVNGGLRTLQSYYQEEEWCPVDIFVKRAMRAVPQEHIDWLSTRPMYYLKDGLFISHAARDKNRNRTLEDCCELGNGFYYGHDMRSEYSLIWNTGNPRKIEDQFQVFGHMSHKTVLFYSEKYPNGYEHYNPDDQPYAVDVDSSRSKKLSGINWPSMQIYEQEYI